jgi:Zn-dependent peptidase ImmA (M78 family)
MTKRIKAAITPSVLVWARKSAGYEIDIAAHKLSIDADKLETWEAGTEQPSIPQLRKMSALYKRPLAVFYLAEPPLSFLPMHDFRRLPEFGAPHFSPALTLEIRKAHEKRTLALELLAENGDAPPKFDLTTSLTDKVDEVGMAIRKRLQVTYDMQASWRDPLTAFRSWRTRIEDVGVLVFQATQVESDEASGFAYWAETLPFMVVNRKDVYARRSFSLLHELAHLMLHQSGVSDLDRPGNRSQKDERIEVFCNQVAAATLMPRLQFLNEPLVAAHSDGPHEWPDETIKALAQIYGASREAIVRRLLTFGLTSEAFYRQKRNQYAIEYQQAKQRQKEQNGDKSIARNMPVETVANVGRPLVRIILDNYHQDRMTLSEVSGYLGIKVRHIAGVEQQLGYS